MFKFLKSLKRPEPEMVPKKPRVQSYRAVSIQVGERACACAIKLESKRWLTSQAPRLPLPDCTSTACACRYRHYEDRRREPRRYTDRAHFPKHYAGPERRTTGRGRRVDDRVFM